MRYKFSPQRNDRYRVAYTFDREVIKVSYREATIQQIAGEPKVVYVEVVSDQFDFSSMGDGSLVTIDTLLPVNPIIKAERVDGVLSVELLSYIGADTTEADRFPDWEVV